MNVALSITLYILSFIVILFLCCVVADAIWSLWPGEDGG